MKYYNLKNNTYVNGKDSKSLAFLYTNFIGRLFLKVAISKPIRTLYCKYISSKYSKHKINRFIKKNNIDMKDYENVEYSSFNDFFMRKINPKARVISNNLIAVADSKLTVYKLDENSSFKIKGSTYTVNELLQEEASIYNNGYALVFRLCVDDYHHYVFPDNGKVIGSKKINGVFHTVQPIAFKKYKVFHENARTITYLNCENLGRVSYIEVGAMMIGKIVNEKVKYFEKGQEKGHFEFGGSTIILLFEKDKIKINDQIIKNSKEGIETIVKLGEDIS